VLKCLDSACTAADAPAEVLALLVRFSRATGDVDRAKEACFKWLRKLQAHGWQEDQETSGAVVDCIRHLFKYGAMLKSDPDMLLVTAGTSLASCALYT
jgi:hypothetical protein